MKALRLQVLHTCVVSRGHTPFDVSPSLSVNTTRNSGPKRPRRLVCFASTVNKLVACFASSSERQKRQRHFKAILLHTEVVYFPRIFPLYLPLTYLDKLYGKCTDLYVHAQTVNTRRSSPIFQAPGDEASIGIIMGASSLSLTPKNFSSGSWQILHTRRSKKIANKLHK